MIIIKINLYYKDKDLDFILECGLISIIKREKAKYLTEKGLDVKSVQNLIFDKDHRNELILKQGNLYDQLLENNNEIDLEECGKYIQRKKRIVVDEKYNIVSNYKIIKKLTLPDGKEKNKSYSITKANINLSDNPLIISDKNWISKDLLFKKYIFSRNYFIKHLSREQFDSLYKLAEKLNDSNQMAEIIAYDKEEAKRTPIILRSRGKNYPKAYIEGRVNNNQFVLILHLSTREFVLTPKTIMKEEIIEVPKVISANVFKENLSNYKYEFETKEGKKTIYQGKVTKGFKEWLKDEIGSQIPISDEAILKELKKLEKVEKIEEEEEIPKAEIKKKIEKELFKELNKLMDAINQTPFKKEEVKEIEKEGEFEKQIEIAEKQHLEEIIDIISKGNDKESITKIFQTLERMLYDIVLKKHYKLLESASKEILYKLMESIQDLDLRFEEDLDEIIKILKVLLEEKEKGLRKKLELIEMEKKIEKEPIIEQLYRERKLMEQFEKETGKKAVWRGEKTKAYKEWQEKKIGETKEYSQKLEPEPEPEKDLFKELNRAIKKLGQTPFSKEKKEEKTKIKAKFSYPRWQENLEIGNLVEARIKNVGRMIAIIFKINPKSFKVMPIAFYRVKFTNPNGYLVPKMYLGSKSWANNNCVLPLTESEKKQEDLEEIYEKRYKRHPEMKKNKSIMKLTEYIGVEMLEQEPNEKEKQSWMLIETEEQVVKEEKIEEESKISIEQKKVIAKKIFK